MGKIYPDELKEEVINVDGSMMSSSSSKSERYTVRMKSLVFYSNGCTVYNSDGDIVYRVDNYDTKATREIYLMDLPGIVLCTIHKKTRVWMLGRVQILQQQEEGDEVVRGGKMWEMKRKAECEMRAGSQKYWIVAMGKGNNKAALRISNMEAQIVAEIKQKESWSGVALGDDVVIMEVEADADHSLIMAFFLLFCLLTSVERIRLILKGCRLVAE